MGHAREGLHKLDLHPLVGGVAGRGVQKIGARLQEFLVFRESLRERNERSQVLVTQQYVDRTEPFPRVEHAHRLDADPIQCRDGRVLGKGVKSGLLGLGFDLIPPQLEVLAGHRRCRGNPHAGHPLAIGHFGLIGTFALYRCLLCGQTGHPLTVGRVGFARELPLSVGSPGGQCRQTGRTRCSQEFASLHGVSPLNLLNY